MLETAFKVLGTLQLRQLAELATGRDFSSAWNEDVMEGAPEIQMLSLDDINAALGTDHAACAVYAWGYMPVAWDATGVLLPGHGLPTKEEQYAAYEEGTPDDQA